MEIHKILAFIKRDFLMEWSYRFSFCLNILGIFVSVVTFYFIAKILGEGASPYLSEYGGEYFPFVLIGIAFSGYFSTALKSFAFNIRREQFLGTLEAMLITPTKISTVILASSLWDFLFASITVLIYLFFGIFFFGLKLFQPNIFLAGIILILTIICFSGIGMISAGFIMLFKKGDPITWLISTFSSLLGGVYFPIEILPQTAQKLSAFIPITYALRSIRLILLQGASAEKVVFDIFILLAFVVVLLPIGILVFKFAVKMAKIEGSLTHY
jgi:ABC-2 type transport system permease protein